MTEPLLQIGYVYLQQKNYIYAEKYVRMGIGWCNIQSRVDYLNGLLDLKSDPGEGTIVHIEINLV